MYSNDQSSKRFLIVATKKIKNFITFLIALNLMICLSSGETNLMQNAFVSNFHFLTPIIVVKFTESKIVQK